MFSKCSSPQTSGTSTPSERSILLMKPVAHEEKHTDHSAILRDAIIGFADGLTVPFALTASLSSLNSSKLVIIGGLAELFAGSISMGLGGWLATVTENEAYKCEERRERLEVIQKPDVEEEEIYEIFDKYRLERSSIKPIVEGLKKDPEMWVKFMMDFELRLEKPDPSKAWISALTLGLSYFIGGLIPMIPYFAIQHNITLALFVSIAITGVILIVFGYFKAIFIGTSHKTAFVSAVQTLAVGAAAAGTSYWIVRGVNALSPVKADGLKGA